MDLKITVFTATYNRGSLLKRLYSSLKMQTDYRFEWIIIDDGSIDDTEQIVSCFSDHVFKVTYKKQVHGGKHRAINKGLELATGEFFYIVDSDDYLPKDSIEIINRWIEEIDDGLVGVSGLKVLANGAICGGAPNMEKEGWVDATNFERAKYGLLGDKAEVYRTSIMKKYRFPEFEGETFLTEAVCWDAIAAKKGKIRWYNVPIYIAEYQEDGLTKSGANELKGREKNFKGYCYYVKQSLAVKPSLQSITDFRAYNKTCRYMGMKLSARAKGLDMRIQTYLSWSYLKMPFLYLCRILKYKILK